ncbi:dienelactone hydrolase family protein [Craurococcus roseus]|uniref:Dienelactone hydrolase family protein n=1 Tax=Craurococcus roseus TaxID=77585 RepID=A0ABN1GA44_9PROT
MLKTAAQLLAALVGLSVLLPARAPGAQTPTGQTPGRIEVIPIRSATLTGEEFLRGGASGREALLAGELRLPATATGAGAAAKVPAVVLVHGSGGISGSIDLWARDLNAAGLAVFVLDSFSGRGITSTVADQNQLHSLAMMVDAYRALDALSRHPRIRADRIAVLGFSKGAVASVYSAVERFRQAHAADGGQRFAAHVGLYTLCNVSYRDDARVSAAPIRLFHGAADDYVAVDPCRGYVARLKEAGADAALTEYAGAHHGFDSPLIAPLVPVPNAQTTRNCRLAEDAAGAVRNASTGEVYALERDPCVEKGAHVGHHAEAAAAVRGAAREFLAATLLR